MITIDITLNGVKTKKRIPTSWDGLTFEQYVGVFRAKDDVELLSLFTGVHVDIILKAKIEGVEALLSCLDFLQTTPDWTAKPSKMLGATIPEDITFNALAPYVDCRTILYSIKDKEIKEFVEAYAKYCAIYVQAINSGWDGYDYDKAIELLPEVMKLPASEVVGLGSFFIPKLLPQKKIIKANSPKEAKPRKKSRRATKS